MSSNDFATCVTEYFTTHLVGTRNLSPNTAKSYRDTFCLLLSFVSEVKNFRIEKLRLVDIDDNMVNDFISWLESERKNSITTRNQRLAAIHAFFRYVQMRHPETMLQCQRILAIPFKKHVKKLINYIPEHTLKELLALPDQCDKYGLRDTALMCLLYDSGARVQELIDLSVGDIRIENPSTVRMLGKGRKARIVPIMSQTAQVVQQYMDVWQLDKLKTPDKPLFCNHQENRLTRPGITYILNKYMSKIDTNGSPGEVITPHILRHTKAMHLLRANVNLHYIRDFLGHVNIATTEVYAKADAEIKRKAFEQANIELPIENQTSWQKNDNLLSWLTALGR